MEFAIITLSLLCAVLAALNVYVFLKRRKSIAAVESSKEREKRERFDKGIQNILGYSLNDAMKRDFDEAD